MKLLLENWKRFINENEETMMKMSLYDFDQTEKGWRSFKNPPDQVRVIKKYIQINPDSIEDLLLIWHLGQALAFSGETGESIQLMKQINSKEPHQYNKLYQLFTIFFLEKDMKQFNSLYDQYKGQIAANKDDSNIQIVKCMKQCGDKNNFDYKSAYTTRCKC